ncbi:MAG TPA: FtsX-like permease family protein [Gemmatimonadaceae bacterium]|nr:FtsX-like permease family protein [Gemmatimonadaceae bacterium]
MTAARPSLMRLARVSWWESRSTRRRLALYMSAISLGVAALVAIDSYAANVQRSVRSQSRALLGGDLAVSSTRAFPGAVDTLLDSLAASGHAVARVTTFGSMALAPRTGGTRFSQVRAVSPNWPLYGDVTTNPPTSLAALHAGRVALVDTTLLIALNAEVGDSVQLGFAKFRVIGTLGKVPGEPDIAAAIGPRVLIGSAYAQATGLLVFGSRVSHEVFVRANGTSGDAAGLTRIQERLRAQRIRARTVAQSESRITESIDELSSFLGIVGIVALLLGGIGVASGVHAWVVRKIDIVAVLRCLGATGPQVLLMYSAQAALMGLAGAAFGAALGVLVQFLLPRAIGGFMPIDVVPQLEWMAIVKGMSLGLWIALAFALHPLITLRRVSPLQALRRDADPVPIRRGWRDPYRVGVNLLLLATVLAVAGTRSDSWRDTIGVSVGIAVVLGVLIGSASALSWIARKVLRAGWPYVVRQGVANLYRPANQTRAVVLSLGFGAFLLSTLYLVQSNLLGNLQRLSAESRGNLILFDVQADQETGVDSIVRASGTPVIQRTPIVMMRLEALNGVDVTVLQNDSSRRDSRWALRREYRSTYRDSLFPAESLMAGQWFTRADDRPEVSLESDIAEELQVKVGDKIRWDVQGRDVETILTSIRGVNWTRFEPNFFAVFEPEALASAPRTFVLLANSPDQRAGASLQRDVVRRYPNVAIIDLTLIRQTVAEITRRATVAIRFLAIFSLAMGIPVLFSAVAATRRERLREGVLLKTLGATRHQIGRIMFAEYALLGLLGSLTGMLLSFAGAWAVMRFVFERPMTPAYGPALALAGATLFLTVSIGFLSGREVFKETAMAALREA